MAPTRKHSNSIRKSSFGYGALEKREMLTGDSVFVMNTTTNTLHIQAAESNVEGAEFANDMSFTVDTGSNELVVDEANMPERRFPLTDLNRISYRGTFSADRFRNYTDISARVVGFAGNDYILSGSGNDTVIAANGDDTVLPGDGNDFVAGGQGNDNILETDTSTGNDRFFGGPGEDSIISGLGRDFVAGGTENDVINTGDDNDYIFGNDGDDEIYAGADRDFVYGGEGGDTIYGEDGDDRILGQNGNDVISGGEGDDSILGGNGNDIIDGNGGDDRVVGNEGNDDLRGGPGADRIVAAVANSQGNFFGIDTVDAGDDESVDTVLAHPIDAVLGLTDIDAYVNAEVIRLIQQVRYLRDNILKPDWVETSSGLQYRIVTAGDGASPTASDRVRVNYRGTFIDGTVFDANDGIEFPLGGVISGWIEGLQLINVGSTVELAIPAELAYGVNGRSGIPGGSTLLFTVDLLAIV